MYRFPYPKTKPVDFKDIAKGVDEQTAKHLEYATIHRARLYESLETNPASPQLIIQSAEKYLPAILALNIAVDQYGQLRAALPGFRWSSALCDEKLTWKSERFELVMVLMVLGYANCNAAFEQLENSPNETMFQEAIKTAAKQLTVASGVFRHTYDQYVLHLKDTPSDTIPDICPTIVDALARSSLAQAQQLSIEKALSAGTSTALIAKLAMRASELYKESNDLLQVDRIQLSKLSRGFVALAGLGRRLYEGLVYRLLAEDSWKRGKYGEGVALIRKSISQLNNVPLPKSAMSQYTDLRLLYDKFIEPHRQRIREALESYQKENDTLYYDPIPEEIPPLPEAKAVMNAVTFTPPAPLFDTLQVVDNSKCCVM